MYWAKCAGSKKNEDDLLWFNKISMCSYCVTLEFNSMPGMRPIILISNE